MNELKVIAATLNNADVDVLFGENISDFFISYTDIWKEIQEYYTDHRVMPSMKVMAEKYPELANIDIDGVTDHYVDQLRNEFIEQKSNKIILTGIKKFKDSPDKAVVLEQLQSQLSRLNKYTGRSTVTNIMDFDDAEQHYEEVRKRVAEMGGTPGIPTGIDFIDSAYPTGWQPGELVVILGYTGRAKSYFTTLLACNAYDCGYTPLMVSLEMGASKIRDRVYTIMGSGLFQNSGLALGDIDIDSFNSFKKKYNTGRAFNVLNGDGRANINMNALQPKYNQFGPDVLYLDYAQLMYNNDNGQDMTGRMRDLSSEAKRFAVANQCVVVLISSATPDGKVEDIAPAVEQVAWSKQLAYDADLVIAVHKQNKSDLVDIVCRKNRNGELFSGVLDWDIDNGKIKEVPLNDRFDN